MQTQRTPRKPPKRKPPEDRFWAKVAENAATGCWEWTAALNSKGYGAFWDGKRLVGAHCFAYREVVGVIPADREIDHLCRNRRCVNPAHLDVVTSLENWRRGESRSARQARRTHCLNGHPLSGPNLYVAPSGKRGCRICRREGLRRWYRERKR